MKPDVTITRKKSVFAPMSNKRRESISVLNKKHTKVKVSKNKKLNRLPIIPVSSL